MAAASYNLLIEQGATFSMTVVWQDSLGAPINLTGYQARMQLRTTVEAGSAALSLTSSPAAGITLGTTNGQIDILITPTQTSALGAGSYVYDLEVQAAGGRVDRLLKGSVTVDPEVTR